MLRLEGVSVHIHRIPILHGIDLTVPDGCVVGLIGRNGAGKTTTLRSIMRLTRLVRGAIVFDGKSLAKSSTHLLAGLGIGYLPEDRGLVPSLTVEQNILLPGVATKLRDRHERLARLYEQMPEVAAFAPRKANQLSGGQQKIVGLARALLVGKRLLVLDEPFEGVAPALAQRMAEVLRSARNDGIGVLVAESEAKHVGSLADHVAVIERGAVQQEGAA